MSTKNQSRALYVSMIICSGFVLLGIYNYSTHLMGPRLLLNSLGILLSIILLFQILQKLLKLNK